jgi:tRNA pseudouridine32 synthase / 23S rRNA pseudouridine746 synthase
MDILFQDDSIIIVNKPSGLLTIRDGYNPDLPTVKSFLEEEFGRCWIVHRIDKETSGILIVSRNEISHRILNLAFENHQIHKTYHAIIVGIPDNDKFEINLPLKVDGDRRHRTIVDYQNGKSAKSFVSIIEKYIVNSLVEIKPESGYTHQIRAHLCFSGYPLLGDKLYKKPEIPESNLIDRTALHAFQISFFHPISNQLLTFTAPYPTDFQQALSNIKK